MGTHPGAVYAPPELWKLTLDPRKLTLEYQRVTQGSIDSHPRTVEVYTGIKKAYRLVIESPPGVDEALPGVMGIALEC